MENQKSSIARTTFMNCYVTKPVDLLQFMNVVRAIEDFWFSIVVFPKRKD